MTFKVRWILSFEHELPRINYEFSKIITDTVL